MRTIIVLFWLFLPLSIFPNLSAQTNFECNQAFIDYFDHQPPYPIQNKEQFCIGVQRANSQTELSLQKAINKENLNLCEQQIYENYNITIICLGKTDDPDILAQLAGYNEIMKKRIEATWGITETELLAQLNPLGFGPQDMFTEHFYDHFNQNMVREMVRVKGKGKQLKLMLKDAYLFPEYFANIPVIDRRTKATFTFKDFFYGITLPIDPTDKQDQNKLFNFVLTDFEHPNYCKTKDTPSSFIIWLTLKETFK